MAHHDRKGKKRATPPSTSDADPISSDDDFQPLPIPTLRVKGKSKLTHQNKKPKKNDNDAESTPVSFVAGPSSSSSVKPTKNELKFAHAKAKRAAKQESQRSAKEQAKSEASEAKNPICSTCGQPGHSRSSNKLCPEYKPRRIATTELKRTSIIKTSLINTCKNDVFIDNLQNVVGHIRDITYFGALFANYHLLRCLHLDRTIPSFCQQIFYDMFSMIMGNGNKASADIKASFNQFRQDIPMFDPANFKSQGYSTLVSGAAKQYDTNMRNHLVANFESKTKQYLLIRLSDAGDPFHLPDLTVQQRKSIAAYIYQEAAGDKKGTWPAAIERTEALEAKLSDFIQDLSLGPKPINDITLNANPHLYLRWMLRVLERVERNVFVQEQCPPKYVSSAYVKRNVDEIMKGKHLSKKASSSLNVAVRTAIRQRSTLQLPRKVKLSDNDQCYRDLDQFIRQTVTEIEHNDFRPLKYTDPKGSRRFTLAPLMSFQKRHITLDVQAFSRLLCSSGIKEKTFQMKEEAREEYFRLFDMSKIGFPTWESLETERSVFW
ncbi:uncharacterized protein BYT42DRAFT_615999 [Radiomyces spectabilis]|uniref:uncharacterized protein n=1 Tax=Radiomyces spectabilis TaxID=64574 RepID=UPI00221E3FAD|nr:uncharacterized protein BYT42DRAFT_615999 [Radiomyces spectabilis]KAI8372795.1 hypothetical protein BYT42DRAFT_615999 [Radiomyces spectabilis]